MNTEIAGGKSADFTNSLVDSIRDNPLPAALIGAGLLWLFAGNGSLNQVKQTASRAGMDRLPGAVAQALSAQSEAVRSGVKGAFDGASSVASGVVDTLSSSAAAGLRDGAASMAHRIGSQVESPHERFSETYGRTENIVSVVRSNLSDLLQRQPLLLGVIGLAIGAGMAASAPMTAAETDLLGPGSDALKQKTKEYARQGGEVAVAAAKAVAKGGAASQSAGEPLH